VRDTTYKGYRIRHSAIYGTCWIEKDGVNICHARDEADARAIIDRDLVGGA